MKSTLKNDIAEYVRSQPDIMLAWFHGSFVKSPVWRDIDIAVYMHPEPDLLRLGEIQAEMEDIAARVAISEVSDSSNLKIDLSLVNKAYETDPVFAQEVVNEGELIRNNACFDDATLKNRLADFKLRCLKHFSDTERMRAIMDRAFRRRLEEGKFGRHNFTCDAD